MKLSKQEMMVLIENTKQIPNWHVGNHFNTLLGERKAGSKWNGDMTEDKLMSLEWNDNTGAMDPMCMMLGCHYYVAHTNDLFPGATVGAISLYDARMMGLEIKYVVGTHGPELQAKSAWADIYPTKISSMIVGEEAGKQVIFTVHPGLPLAPLIKDFDGDLGKLNPQTAVKLV